MIIKAHRKRPDHGRMRDLIADPERPLSDQIRVFEHRDHWANRMILGDSLVVISQALFLRLSAATVRAI